MQIPILFVTMNQEFPELLFRITTMKYNSETFSFNNHNWEFLEFIGVIYFRQMLPFSTP